MEDKINLPKRKSARLNGFYYGYVGAYFVTICVRDRMNILSEIIKTDIKSTPETIGLYVGEGLAPPENKVR